MYDEKQLMRQRILISGANGFLGRLLVFHLLNQGFELLLMVRDENSLDALSRSILEIYKSAKVNFILCDLSKEKSWIDAVKELDNFEISTFINCAAVQGNLQFKNFEYPSDLHEVFKVNLYSSIFFTDYILSKNTIERKKIIHFSGGGATRARPQLLSYGLSKTSLVRYIENCSAGLPQSNFDVNAIAPGIMPSQMQTQISNENSLFDSSEFHVAQKSLNESIYDPEKILGLCDFLLSNESNGITGKLISADWDNWQAWPKHIKELKESDLYTLRRITGRDRNMLWGDK